MNENLLFSTSKSSLRLVTESQSEGERCYYCRSMIKTLSKFSLSQLPWLCIFPCLLIKLWSGANNNSNNENRDFITTEASPDWNLLTTLPWNGSSNWHNSFSFHLYFSLFKIVLNGVKLSLSFSNQPWDFSIWTPFLRWEKGGSKR